MSSPVSPLSMRFWRSFVVTLRPYLMFVSLAAGMVGLALTDAGPASLSIFAAVFFLTYGLGQAVTDTFQMDTDALSAPQRPLVQGVVRARDVRIVALAGLAGCAGIVIMANPWNALLAVASVFGLVAYTWFKRRWWGGPPWNSWIVALLPAMGALCGGMTATSAVRDSTLLALMGAVFCTYACFVLLGYLKDVEADRATGYVTFPVRFGRRPTIVASAVHAAIGLWLSLVALLGELGPGHLLCSIGWALLFGAHAVLWTVVDDREAHRGVAMSALGFVAIHLGAVAILRGDLTVAAFVLFACAVIAMGLRRTREQV